MRGRMGSLVGTRSIAEAKVVQHHIGDRGTEEQGDETSGLYKMLPGEENKS